MTKWQPIDSAPKDGTPVKAGRITALSIGGVPMYPLTSRFIDGDWHADFGSKGQSRWARYDPQPTHWLPPHNPE